MEFNGRNVFFWPVPIRRAVDSVAVMLMQVYMLARGRAAASASPVMRTLAGRDEEAIIISYISTSGTRDASRRPLDSADL